MSAELPGNGVQAKTFHEWKPTHKKLSQPVSEGPEASLWLTWDQFEGEHVLLMETGVLATSCFTLQ